jgi:hypothetical protein
MFPPDSNLLSGVHMQSKFNYLVHLLILTTLISCGADNNDSSEEARLVAAALAVKSTKYFIVQNIATERSRLYEKKCNKSNICKHKLIMETEIAAGKDTKRFRTWLGSYRITRWVKFYQDYKQFYPSFYDPKYPALPGAGARFSEWKSKDIMPLVQTADMRSPRKIGIMRGGFGWYTATIGPNHFGQWTHGTVGWGADGDKFIGRKKSFWANAFSDPRSGGCSRHTNPAVAYLHHLTSVGTPLIKIYAKEALLDKDRKSYTQRTKNWDYILTTNGVRRNGQGADKQKVLAAGTPSSRFLEEGTLTIDTFPNLVYFTPGEKLNGGSSKLGDKGNTYKINSHEMSDGVFYVDAGLISRKYKHPQRLGVGGINREIAPSFALLKSGNDTSNASLIDSEKRKK